MDPQRICERDLRMDKSYLSKGLTPISVRQRTRQGMEASEAVFQFLLPTLALATSFVERLRQEVLMERQISW